jgi:CDP-glycerol glycerophosphotransferase (TagB/SpsB family)
LLQNKENAKKKMYERFPELKDKKVVYYAPTFRTYDVEGPEKLINQHNPEDFALIFTCHPNQKIDIDESKIYKLNSTYCIASYESNIIDKNFFKRCKL